MKIQWHNRKTTRASFPGGKHVACSLYPALTRLWLFGCVYPTDKVPPRNRRETAPFSLRDWCSGKGLAKIGGQRGLSLFFSRFCVHVYEERRQVA